MLLALAAQSNAAKDNKGAHWVGTWATSPQAIEPRSVPPSPGLNDNTLRQVVHVSIGGKKIRVRFSNLLGATALTIPSAHVALPAGDGMIRAESDKALTFHGNAFVT